MTTKDRIHQALLANGGTLTNAEIAGLFKQGDPGCLSWSQRLRSLRQDYKRLGGDITTLHLSGGTYEYRLIKPPAKDEKGQFLIIDALV